MSILEQYLSVLSIALAVVVVALALSFRRFLRETGLRLEAAKSALKNSKEALYWRAKK
jgi:hypothetical protein